MSENTPMVDVQSKKLTDWSNEPTVADLKLDFEESKSHHAEQVGKIEEWLDNLHGTGKAKVNAGKNNSSIVPKLIRKQAEWRYPALSEPFLSTSKLFNVKPVTWEDKKAALQNGLVLNSQFNTQLDKVTLIDEFVRTAVDEGTVILRTGWDYQEEEYTVQVPDVEYFFNEEMAPTHAHLAQLKASDPEGYAANISPEMQQAHALFEEHGRPVEAQIKGLKNEKRTRVLVNKPTVEVCDFRNVVIDPTCKGDIDKAGFVIYSFESSLSELKRDGKYSNLEHINLETNSILGTPDHTTDSGTRSFNFSDKARKKFVVYEYWGFRDIDGSGVVQPIVAAWVGDVLIRMELNPYPDQKLPFVVVPYLPVRKSTHGEPDGALLEDNQKVIGAVTRGMIDIMGKSANGQIGMRKDMLDVANKRKFEKGLDYEFNANVDPSMGVYMHKYPEIPASAQFMLQLQNMEAESLTGVKAFSSQGLSSASLGDVAAGIRGALDAASKRELAILRRLSAGIIKLGRKIIAMNQAWLSEEEVVRITEEEFVPVRRDDLAGNIDLELSISTAEEDNNKAQELAFMLQTMGNNMDPAMSRLILADIARLRKMPDLAKQIEEYQPQPDPLAQKQAELNIALMEAELAEKQSTIALNTAKIDTEHAKAENLRSDADLKDLEFVEQESGVKQERDLQKQGAQAQAQAVTKVLDHQLRSRENKSKST
jgi:hypothetical protein